MLRVLKSIMKRPLTLHDLEEASATFFRKPPMLNEWRETIERLRVSTGRSLLDWWRDSYRGDLKVISEGGTWERQRSILISTILDLQYITAIHGASKDAKHIGAWAHLVDKNPIFSAASKENWSGVMLQWWLTSIMSDACLQTIGQQLYNVDKLKQLEFELLHSWARDTLKLDVSFMDEALDAVDKDEIGDAAYAPSACSTSSSVPCAAARRALASTAA